MPETSSTAVKIFGSRVRERRRLLGLSQEDVAHLADVHVTNYGRIERGASGPNFSTLLKIASVLAIDPGELVRGLDGSMVTTRPHKFTAAEFIRAREQ